MNWDNAMWAQGRETCGECGERYHRSGTEECACRECETEDCDVVVNTKETTICVDCEDAQCNCLDCTQARLGRPPFNESTSSKIVRALNIHAKGGNS
jgi:hypothetical protein